MPNKKFKIPYKKIKTLMLKSKNTIAVIKNNLLQLFYSTGTFF